MARLILISQYPTKLRYQEWWIQQLPYHFSHYFDQVITLGDQIKVTEMVTDDNSFSPAEAALEYETRQIEEYLLLDLQQDDVLLLCDLSFPGLFSQALFHKRPKKCFAICHATSKNAYDYYMKDRSIKFPIEKHTAQLFNKIFVATEYHKRKLGWKNISVTPFPYPPFAFSTQLLLKNKAIVSVARNTVQKRTPWIEKQIEKVFNTKIETPLYIESWEQYYAFLGKSSVLLITAKEETFGYQIMDAILNNCVPVAPRHFSYPELLPDEYLYSTFNELVNIIIKVLDGTLGVPQLKTSVESRQFYQNLATQMLQ